MKEFVINEETLRKGWGGSDRYWFSLKDYNIVDITNMSDLNPSDGMSLSAFLLPLGFIPYFVVSNEEIMRAYAKTITNSKLKAAIDNLPSEHYVESFWKYFDVYPQLAQGWQEFENEYVLSKAVSWCDDNSINYIVK